MTNFLQTGWKVILALALVAGVVSCQPAAAAGPDLKATAYAQATQIGLEGEATAIVQAARATANARLSQISGGTLTPAPGLPALATALPPAATTRPLATPEPTFALPQLGSPTPVELLGVNFGADGNLIMVQFNASPKAAQNWFQGSVIITDEATGLIYDQISVAPLIGPLISRPREEGQQGYAMLTNLDNTQKGSLKGGELVTVMLGVYRFEHVLVKNPS